MSCFRSFLLPVVTLQQYCIMSRKNLCLSLKWANFDHIKLLSWPTFSCMSCIHYLFNKITLPLSDTHIIVFLFISYSSAGLRGSEIIMGCQIQQRVSTSCKCHSDSDHDLRQLRGSLRWEGHGPLVYKRQPRTLAFSHLMHLLHYTHTHMHIH